ncbi:diaminobutyrate acetyltransferase [Acidiphilium sp. C61]|uniref:diaminobutyrate acetyltransferase n=1 Tax=Acidiphilium sp. C61 TaxID=1671485 RepID=UPI000BD1BCD0|nr:diaminobutyrate acetyltransferase [Acidiphilium sp. C61]OYV55464.1 MAG: diaminobutyrate acetyltransferase [Acidiphilium sp. 20-67-58]OYV83907.1 MAG: diaminobutyrate acetyltransferase [Acidiphilium sp. 21-68-69]
MSLRRPIAADGPAVTALIAECPPLDTNSAYCNLLQCTDFAETCVIAEREGEVVGWISGYLPPSNPSRIFVWQVAVSAAARGIGLGGQMLDALLDRQAVAGARALTTTITEANTASWRLFESLARRRGASFVRAVRFDRATHFAGRHDTEFAVTIGLPRPVTDQA